MSHYHLVKLVKLFSQEVQDEVMRDLSISRRYLPRAASVISELSCQFYFKYEPLIRFGNEELWGDCFINESVADYSDLIRTWSKKELEEKYKIEL